MFLRRYERRSGGRQADLLGAGRIMRTGRGSRQRVVAYLGELTRSEQNGWAQLGRSLSGKQAAVAVAVRSAPLRRAVGRRAGAGRSAAAFAWSGCATSATCGWPWDCGGCWAWTRCWRAWREPGREEVPWPVVAAILDDRPILRAVERIAHRDDVVSRHGVGGPVGRAGGEGPHRPAVRGLGLAAAAQGGDREASEGAAGRAVRPGVRPAVVRRDQHVLRGPVRGQSAWPSAATRATAGPTACRSASAWW